MIYFRIRIGQFFYGVLFILFLLTYYAAKFPSHYRLNDIVDFSYVFLFLLVFFSVVASGLKLRCPNSYLVLIFINGLFLIYSIGFTHWIGPVQLNALSTFIEGNTYYSKSDFSWITSPVLSFILMFFVPLGIQYLSNNSLVLVLRLFILVNAYFAIFQCLALMSPIFFKMLPILIGVPFEGSFNLNFGRAVGLTSANGSFYFGVSLILSGLILNTFRQLKLIDLILVSTCVLSLSRTVMIIYCLFVILIMVDRRVGVLWYVFLIILMVSSSFVLFSSELWSFRMMFDNSQQIRSSQLLIALDLVKTNPFGVGSNLIYYFDGTVTSLIVKFGIFGPLSLLVNLYLVALCLARRYDVLSVIIILLMLLVSLFLIGGPFSYLSGLFGGILLIGCCKYEKGHCFS